jgi:hypothetical protein
MYNYLFKISVINGSINFPWSSGERRIKQLNGIKTSKSYQKWFEICSLKSTKADNVLILTFYLLF